MLEYSSLAMSSSHFLQASSICLLNVTGSSYSMKFLSPDFMTYPVTVHFFISGHSFTLPNPIGMHVPENTISLSCGQFCAIIELPVLIIKPSKCMDLRLGRSRHIHPSTCPMTPFMVMSVRFSMFLKAREPSSPMLLMVIDFRPVHPLKHSDHSSFVKYGNVTSDSFLHPLNASLFTTMFSGRVIFFRAE